MGFPIAIGSKSVASRPVALAEPIEEFASDGSCVLLPAHCGSSGSSRAAAAVPTIIFANSPDHELFAVITLSYYDMEREDSGEVEYCTAEIRVQISPTAQATSMDDRDSLYRIALPCTGRVTSKSQDDPNSSLPSAQMNGTGATSTTTQTSTTKEQVTRMAVFSSDRRFLTCLIPHPFSTNSTVVVFQLRKPKESKKRQPRPPLPSYITPSLPNALTAAEHPVTLYVATNPRVLMVKKKNKDETEDCEPLLNVTALTDVGTSLSSSVASAAAGHATTTTTPAGPSMLLLGCRDGSVLVASYRPLLLAGKLYQRPEYNNDDESSVAIASMDHLTEWTNQNSSSSSSNDGADSVNETVVVVGRLAVVFANGTVSVFRSHLTTEKTATAALDSNKHGSESAAAARDDALFEQSVSIRSMHSESAAAAASKSALSIGLTETHELPDCVVDTGGNETTVLSSLFVCAKWIAGSYLALMQQPGAECDIHVFGLYDNGRSASVSTLNMTWSRLEENAGSTFQVDAAPTELSNGNHRPSIICANRDTLVSLEYDAYSDCVAVSSFLLKSDGLGARQRTCPFVCLWSWRTNAQSFSANAAPNAGSDDSVCISSVHFAVDPTKRRKLVHMIASAVSTYGPMRVRKETYDTAILSPPHEVVRRGARLEEACSLLLSSTAVSYPCATKISSRENFEMQWADSSIPKTYLSAYGAPVVAAIGKNFGRSIAVASSRGLCVLDCSGSDRSHAELSVCLNSVSNHGQRRKDESVTKLLRMGHVHPRWRLFGNAADERAFRVLAMTWWEGTFLSSDEGLGTVDTDDLLVAVIEVLDGREDSGYYLSCWSSRNIELSGQLLGSRLANNGRTRAVKWGALLPMEFVPESMDLLACPVPEGSEEPLTAVSLERKACVLLADTSHFTRYLIYQLTVVGSDTGHAPEPNLYKVFSRCSATGTIGSPAKLFLASASFIFSFADMSEDTSFNEVDKASVAVIGVLRMYGGGLDALSVHSSSVVAVGQVIDSADSDIDDPRESELSRLWLSDIVFGRSFADDRSRADFFVWVLQLATGRLVSWSVPFVRSADKLFFLIEPRRTFADGDRNAGANTVCPNGITLGIVCPAGTASSWMQQSANGARGDFLAGHVPRSTFGYVVGVAQSCTKLHRSLGEDFERDLFRPDFLDHEIRCPSEFVLYPPGSLASLYSMAMDAVTDPMQELDNFGRHIKRRMGARTLHTMLLMSIQLMVLRSVEKIAAISKSRGLEESLKRALVQGMLVTLVETVRRQTTPLQFATLFLKVGRQIEPSCYPCLFPLPPSPSSTPGSGETMDDLFNTSLAHGSISMAVAALPLLVDSQTTKSMCAATFHHCLINLDASFESGQSYELEICQEELTATGDVFRYALKLSDRETGGDRYPNDDSDNEDGVPERGYSIMCGISNIFSRRQVARKNTTKIDASPVLVHGLADAKVRKMQDIGIHSIQRLSSWQNCNCDEFKTVAGVAARYILSSIFDADALIDNTCWRKVGALAALLIGDTKTEFYCCTADEFAHLVQNTKTSRYGALIPLESRRGGLAEFFDHCIFGCSQAIDELVAGGILDLVLILLGCESNDFKADIPGLLLVAIVSAHVSGRITEILKPDDGDSLLWTSYLEVRTKQSSYTQQDGIAVI